MREDGEDAAGVEAVEPELAACSGVSSPRERTPTVIAPPMARAAISVPYRRVRRGWVHSMWVTVPWESVGSPRAMGVSVACTGDTGCAARGAEAGFSAPGEADVEEAAGAGRSGRVARSSRRVTASGVRAGASRWRAPGV
ncbi:MAG: hypothetical protein R3F14_09155 [Polyangiaceae bacterium]